MCAALSAAGCCDACATPDGDALLYGAESLLHTVKLQVGAAAAAHVCWGGG